MNLCEFKGLTKSTIQAEVIDIKNGKYIGNILQPDNNLLSLHQMKQGFFEMNLCEFKGLTNSAILAGKLLTLKIVGLANTGYLRYHCSRLIYAPSSTKSTCQLDTLLIYQECKLGHPTFINCSSNCCMCNYSSSLSRLPSLVVSLYIAILPTQRLM